MKNYKKPELLAPAGGLETLKIAVLYGADAVYLGGFQYGLRANAKNFTQEQMREGIQFAHAHGVKVYITGNIIPHNIHLKGMAEYFKAIRDAGADGLIVADPGVFMIAKETVPDLPLHISTQANNTNYQSARFWYEQGAERIVVARELSLEEIKEIKQKAPEKLELEAFVHGAMCISYSGRCLLSNYMAGRDANLGACTHPCRWKYHLVEETRPGEYMPVTEDEQGTYIFNSKDLCMIEYIPELIQAGIQSLKIEGRMKTSLYVATVVKTYREAIDDFFQDPLQYEKKKPYYVNELKKCNYRPFTTGFYIQKPKATEQIYDNNTYIRDYTFVGLVIDYNEDTQIATIQQRNKFAIGDELEIVRQKKDNFIYHVNQMWDEEGQEISAAPHPKQVIQLKIDQNVQKYDILRKKE